MIKSRAIFLEKRKKVIQNFFICLEAVLPLFILILIGIGVRAAGLLNGEEVRRVNKFVFVVFFPCMMFKSICQSDISHSLEPGYVAFGLITVLATCLISVPITLKIEKDRGQQGVMIQDSFRSNFVIMGIPVIANIFGADSLGVPTMMMAIIVPFFNILAVIIFETFRGGKISVGSILKGICKNPIILGTIAGLLFNGLHIPLLPTVKNVVFGMGDACSILALIILGASFHLEGVKKKARNLIIIIISRLIIVPGILLGLAAILGYRDVEFVTLIIMFAAPPSVSSYTMAEAMDSDGELAGNAVIFGSALSCLTLFLWLFLFKSLGVF